MADKTETDTKFEGQTVSTEHFTVTSGDNIGRPLVIVRPAG